MANNNEGFDPPLAISDAEMAAYVEDRLPPKRRTAIEGFLAANPDLAAVVMRELHRRGRCAAPQGHRSAVLWLAVLAAAALVALGFAVGWWMADQLPAAMRWGFPLPTRFDAIGSKLAFGAPLGQGVSPRGTLAGVVASGRGCRC